MKTKSFQIAVKLALVLCLLIPCSAGATTYTLTVVAQGSGTVTPDNTNNPHPAGVVITIIASNNPGWYFSNWSGDAGGSVNPLQVTMNSNMVITGNFLAYPTYTLALVTNGQGRIDLSPPGGSYLSNTVVTATATAATGWVFVTWSGVTNTSANPVSLTMNASASVTGTFAQLPAFDVQPAGITNKTGSTVSFSAHAVGNAPLGYQWFFSGGSLSGSATNTTLTLTNVSSTNAGTYWLVATNTYGGATSQIASLTLTNSSGPTNLVNSPDEASLRAAIKIGGWIGFGFNGTITLTNTILITNNVILDANNVSAAISGGNAVRIFYVTNGASLTASNLTLANGCCLVTNGPPGTNADAGAIYNNGTVNLIGCTLTNNSAQSLVYAGLARGGAIFNNAGTVLLFASTVVSNSVIGGLTGNDSVVYPGLGFGGAIFNTNGSVNIMNSAIKGNLCTSGAGYTPSWTSTGGSFGGAMFHASGNLVAVNDSFSMNSALGGSGPGLAFGTHSGNPAYGGALAGISGSVTLNKCQFLSNSASAGSAGYHSAGGPAYGGAVYVAVALTVRDSSFFGNQCLAGNNTVVPTVGPKGTDAFGGAIFNSGIAVLNGCAVYSNFVQGGNVIGYGPSGNVGNGGNAMGGGIFNESQLAATNCTIALDSVSGGGGAGVNTGTFKGSGGNALGGGVFNNTNANLIAMNLTISSNMCYSPSDTYYTTGLASGFQIANTGGTLRLHNSLIAYSGTNVNAYGPITDDGYNICSDGSASLFSGSSYNNTDPQLAPLGDYGGPTWCMALLASSPAIDTGGTAGAPDSDQRGFIRPAGSGPDMGAYEYGSSDSYLLGPPAGQPNYLKLVPGASYNLVSFTTAASKTYRLQDSTNLVSWIDLNTNGPFATPTNVTWIVPKQNFKATFFRLLVQ